MANCSLRIHFHINYLYALGTDCTNRLYCWWKSLRLRLPRSRRIFRLTSQSCRHLSLGWRWWNRSLWKDLECILGMERIVLVKLRHSLRKNQTENWRILLRTGTICKGRRISCSSWRIRGPCINAGFSQWFKKRFFEKISFIWEFPWSIGGWNAHFNFKCCRLRC